ncbi:MAG: hypothetical protein D6677_09685 [Calditrichaeota bacterium]|nr:MAG: hypothetical protein D6677_09685 [Calditrichota bacterium]
MTRDLWEILGPAFFELMILVGIHSYLGIHVIKRKVIFVDLALAQFAALGTTVGFLFGILPGTPGAYWFSLGFAILGAAVFSLSRFKNEKIPQEAVIGLTYALASAVAILVIDKAPHGAEHIKELLTGSILWVKWSTIGKAAAVYSLVGIFHFLLRDKFLLISSNPEKAYATGMSVRLWDFLFYMSFAVVITHSVGTAGVLLVFVFLVAPAVTSIMITDILWKQLAIGWSMGVLVSIIGLWFSYIFDLPSGPTVVAFYGFVLLLVALTLHVLRSAQKSKAVGQVVAGTLAFTLVGLGFYAMGHTFGNLHHEAHAASKVVDANQLANMDDDAIRSYLAGIDDLELLDVLYHKQQDDHIRILIATRLAQLDSHIGLEKLQGIMKNSSFPFIREEAREALEQLRINP